MHLMIPPESKVAQSLSADSWAGWRMVFCSLYQAKMTPV
jgi:hypothetical protein